MKPLWYNVGMRISGLLKTTLLDYPEHIACTIFLGRCNLRCPFCHNMELVESPEHFKEFTLDEIMTFLKGKIGKLTGVAITGGEPLLNDDIEDLLIPIKNMGYSIKLDTNGFFPDKLKKIIDDKLIDMVAMDIKAGATNYLKVSGLDTATFKNSVGLPNRVKESIDIIMNSGLNYEFRTTCVKGLHTSIDFQEIKDIIKGAKKYFLQNYKAAPGMEDLPYKPFEKEELEKFKDIVAPNVKYIEIRGVS